MSDDIKLRPVQVFLDTKRFIQLHEHPPGGAKKDFYQGNDLGFSVHKEKIRSRLVGIGQALRTRREPAGFVRIQMREDAFGKSYRPLGALFRSTNNFSLVGTDHIGEMIFQATPEALENLSKIVEERAELTPRKVLNEKTGVIEERVSAYRAEVGALDDIQLHDAADRVPFSTDEAMAWLNQSNVIGGYIVELFQPDLYAAPAAIQTLAARLVKSLKDLPSGVRARGFHPRTELERLGEPTLALTVDLLQDSSIKDIEIPLLADNSGQPGLALPSPSRDKSIAKDRNPDHHAAFLTALSEQALVRSVDLPPMMEAAPAATGTDVIRPKLAPPVPGSDYPIVGIIDGGVAVLSDLEPWREASAGLVSPADKDERHGTFIAGIVSGASTLNPHLSGSVEGAGCKFYDLDIFPRRELRQSYFGSDIDYFFDLLDEKIKTAKRDHGVRIFNFSFGLHSTSTRFAYTAVADRLDRMAHSNDVILVVSAGNLPTGASRRPWPQDPVAVTNMLASYSGNQKLSPPAEQFLGVTVGAINPPGVAGHEADLPTTYTRRGPGVGGCRKPDIAHYGGAEPAATGQTGLASLTPSGSCVEQCGTSFAAPNAAATLATLDQRLARSAGRETLLALPVHRASRSQSLSSKALRHISREYVGFGLPPTADAILADEDNAITLLFSEVLPHKRKLEFPFSWPAALTSTLSSCRGMADVTIAFTPPIDASHRDEALRVELEAHLYQEAIDGETGELIWESRLTQDGAGLPQGMPKTERYLLTTGLKWSPIKRYHLNMPQGRGHRSNWKLALTSLTRAGAAYPSSGIPFTLALTISDPKGGAPIHDEVRNMLRSQGLTLADITVAHRVRARG